MRRLGSNAHFSASIARSAERSRDNVQDFQFADIKTKCLLCKTLFPLFSKLFVLSVSLTLENIHPSDNFKGKIPLNRCAGTETKFVMLMLRSIDQFLSF